MSAIRSLFYFLITLLLKGIAKLPLSWLIALGNVIGLLFYWIKPSRYRIAKKNIALCFPELSANEQDHLVKKTLQANAIGLFETLLSWWGNKALIKNISNVEGLELVEECRQQNQGILLVGGHYTCLDLGGCMMAQHCDMPMQATYRQHKNSLMEDFFKHARGQYFTNMIARRETRKMIKCLRQGDLLWYAPDQDYGREGAVFVPFFNQTAATLTATSKLAKAGRAKVLFTSFFRNADNRSYTMRITNELISVPSGDETKDTELFNQVLEKHIRRHPEQYMWVHRRFKTTVNGRSDFYN